MQLTWAQLSAAFTAQAKFSAGYSPLYEAICTHVAGVTDKCARLEPLEFDEQALIDLFQAGYAERTFTEALLEPTLLFLGALHAAILSDAPEAIPLSRFYATVDGDYNPAFDHDVLIQMLGGLFMRPAPILLDFMKHGRIQTNEVSRGAAWLLPALFLTAEAGGALPITLVDLGCSAGLNLAADAQRWQWLVTDGDRTLNLNAMQSDPLIVQRVDFGKAERPVRERLPPGTLTPPTIVKRIGIDLNPLPLDNPENMLNLRALIWGDQAARLARFDQAIAAYQALDVRPEVHTANIIEAARTLADQVEPGSRLLLVYNTTVTIYLDDADYSALRRNIEASFRALPTGTRGVWLELEAPRFGEPPVPPRLMVLKAHVLDRSGELEARYLAYTEAHPQTIMLLEGWTGL